MRFRSRARLMAFLLAFLSCTVRAQEPPSIFTEQCSSCHTIGGGTAVGPDLKGVGKRRTRAWIIRFIHNPQAMIAKKDPIAVGLRKQFPDVEMPAFPNLTTAQIQELLNYIAEKGKSEPAQ